MSAFGAKADLVNSMIGAECSATSVRGMTTMECPLMRKADIHPQILHSNSTDSSLVSSRSVVEIFPCSGGRDRVRYARCGERLPHLGRLGDRGVQQLERAPSGVC